MTTSLRASALADVCPVCSTTGASQHNRCVFCGTWFVCRHCRYRFATDQVTMAEVCPDCGTPIERPDVTTQVSPVLPQVAAEPVAAPLSSDLRGVADILRAHLVTRPTAGPVASSVREAQVVLADVLAGNERDVEAISVLDGALTEPGPPDDAAVQLRRALALRRIGDEVEATKAVLAVVATAPDEYVDVLTALTTEITATAARSLESYLSRAWGDEAETTRQARPTTRGAIHGLRAGAALSRGQLDLAITELEEAAADDQDLAEDLWPRLAARPEASAARIAGGAAGALSFRARGFAAVGDRSTAEEIARAVLAEALTAENKPEAECHLILAEGAADPGQRGYHLTEAGRLIGARAGPDDLERSLKVLDRAAQEDPDRAETYWYWSDNQRVAAYAAGAPDPAGLRLALAIWERGRELGPCDGAWPHLVEAAICGALCDVGEGDEVQWAFRALRAAVDAVVLDDGAWTVPWLSLAKASRRLQLWCTSRFAIGRVESLMGEPDVDNEPEVEELVVASYHMQPERLAHWVDAYEAISVPDSWSHTLRAAAEARTEHWSQVRRLLRDIPDDTQDGVATLRTYLLTVSGTRSPDTGSATRREQTAEVDPPGASELAWLDLLAGDAESCLSRLEALPSGGAGELVDLCNELTLRTHCSLMLGEHDDARRWFRELSEVVRPGNLLDLRVELRWLANWCRDKGDEESAVLADELWEETWSTAPRTGSGEDVPESLAELDDRLAQHSDGAPGNPELSAARALVSMSAGPRAIDPEDWPLVLIIELGSALVPADAEDNWESWSLFTELIPQARDELRLLLGFPVMGIRIRGSYQLGPHDYRPIVNGRGSARGVADPTAFPPGRRIAEYAPGGAPWRECLEALQAAVLADPAEVLVPHTMETLLAEWREDESVPDHVVGTIESDRLLRVHIWQRLRREVQHRGRLPSWQHGLGVLVEEAMSEVVREHGAVEVSS